MGVHSVKAGDSRPLDADDFLDIIARTPLVSVDIVALDAAGRALLGMRVNRPAQGYWFVPGGRILKGERIADAFARICLRELGIECGIAEARLLGVFDHLYDDNYRGVEGIDTHYVVIAYEVRLGADVVLAPDDQHEALKWFARDELLREAKVHPNTKRYFGG
jgi:colanic acid biosynthesis protein WcaH